MAFDYNVKDWANFVMRVLIPGILVGCLFLVLMSCMQGENLFGSAAGSFFSAFGGSGNVHL